MLHGTIEAIPKGRITDPSNQCHMVALQSLTREKARSHSGRTSFLPW